jgi:ribosomal-protein-alanine N-acetyltransferase
MTPVMTIEPMRWWHLDRVTALEHDLFPLDSWSPEQFWQELALDSRRYVVAVSSGVVVGYAGAFLLPPDSDVQTIAVRADQQGAGVGGRLLAALMRTAGDAGATHMLLEVRSDNAPAIALYVRRGFVAISTRKRYYPDGGDAVIMRCRLPKDGPAHE